MQIAFLTLWLQEWEKTKRRPSKRATQESHPREQARRAARESNPWLLLLLLLLLQERSYVNVSVALSDDWPDAMYIFEDCPDDCPDCQGNRAVRGGQWPAQVLTPNINGDECLHFTDWPCYLVYRMILLYLRMPLYIILLFFCYINDII